jgi:hypothetical protein
VDSGEKNTFRAGATSQPTKPSDSSFIHSRYLCNFKVVLTYVYTGMRSEREEIEERRKRENEHTPHHVSE